MRFRYTDPWIAIVIGVAICSIASLSAKAAEPKTIQFDRDIRPLLSKACFQCHGPDAKKRKADLRLDVKNDVFLDRDGTVAVVPADLDNSELYQRLISDDEDLRMPPVGSEKTLTKPQIELIRRWIEQGAKWQKHWSFVTPTKPALPKVNNAAWIRNPIDAFVLARLEQQGLAASAEVNKSTLIRRVTLDLTGLPPTPAQVDAFLADDSAEAYEKVVDRLLNSHHYGERMATRWLDAARYADTNGYQTDGERYMWRWRDWVIEAFNNNMPFDQFTIEQLAGDMLPNPTLDQRIATGFNRNHRGNGEGGIIPEEYAVEYVIDRVETTSTVWLGLTMGCGRCHDHKYDPVSQEEFYQLYAFFDNIPENGRANKHGNSPPMIKAPTRQQRSELAVLDERLSAAQSEFIQLEPQLAQAQLAWEKAYTPSGAIDWTVTEGMVAKFDLDGRAVSSIKQPERKKEVEPSSKDKPKENPKPTAFYDGEAAYVAGKLGQAGRFDGKRFIAAADVGQFGYFDRFSLSAWIYPEGKQGGMIVSRMTDVDRDKGYYLHLKSGRLQANLVVRWLDDCIRVETADLFDAGLLEANRWQHVTMSYDGSRVAAGIKVYIDGKPVKLQVNLDALNQDFTLEEPLRIGGGGGANNRFHGLIDDVHIYDRVLTPTETLLIATADSIDKIVSIPSEKRSEGQAGKLYAFFLNVPAPENIQTVWQQVHELHKQKATMIDGFPSVMVMEEMDSPRETRLLVRGEYDKPGKKVVRGVPTCLPAMPAKAEMNRIGLARWLVDPSNPLTARVTINRFWQMYFGTGLVKTAEDFGSQGERPSHPRLLDWLATEFIARGWDIKAMQKTIVMSATYRQSSNVTPTLLEKDPDNRLMARGPRLRLSAEMIRDQALFVSGLLVDKIGGPSVKPYQPAGLWEEVAGTKYVQDSGDGLYRRSLYTYWKRTAASPTMMTFDAAPREMCSVLETRTNTPLQALTLMNDVTFVEASRKLAERVMQESAGSAEDRIELAFRLATARKPAPEEQKILIEGYITYLDRYQNDTAAAEKLLAAGESKRNEKLNTAELAAYTTLAGLLLNLDEVVTKE